MKKRILSIVLVLSMVMTLTSAIAANAMTISMADEVYVGNVTLEDGQYILEGDMVDIYTGIPPEDKDYAYFKDRVLHLNNFDLTTHTDNQVDRETTVKCNIGIWQCIPGLGLINDFPLTIHLMGKNTISDSAAEYSVYTHRASGVIFAGYGSLEANRPMLAAAGLTVTSGDIRVTVSAQTDTTPLISTSSFQMSGGKLTLQGTNRNGIVCQSLAMSYGNLNVNLKAKDASTNLSGVKSSGTVTFSGGTSIIQAAGDAVQCSGFSVQNNVTNAKFVSTEGFLAVNADFASLPTERLMTVASKYADGSNAAILPANTTDLDGFAFVDVRNVLSVSGTVRGVANNTKTTVNLYKSGSSTPMKTMLVTGNGEYSFQVLETGEYIVEAMADGYVSFSQNVKLSDFPSSGVCYINMVNAGITISGSISGVASNTVTTVTLYKYGSDTPLQTTTVTGNGKYSFTGVVSDYYAIRAKADGYSGYYYATSLLDGNFTHNITLESRTYFIASNITGVATNTVTTVALYPAGSSTPIKTVTVTGEGYYIIEAAVSAGTYTIKATASGYSNHTAEVTMGSDSIVSHHIAMGTEKPAFTKQPVSGEVVFGEKLTVNWELNFTPTSQRVCWMSRDSQTLRAYKTLTASDTSAQIAVYPSAYQYVIQAFYDDNGTTRYVCSEPFRMTERAPYTANSTFCVGGKMTVDTERLAEADEIWMEAFLNAEITYQWYRNGSAISGATGESYTPVASDVNKTIYAKVSNGSKSLNTMEKMVASSTDFTVKCIGKAVTYTVSGNVVTVTNDKPCKVGYLGGDGKYVTLKGTKNSDVSYSFTAPSGVTEILLGIKGDISGDGRINVGDVSKLYAHVKQTSPLSGDILFIADISGDNRINVGDVSKLYASVKQTAPLTWDT